MRRILLIVGSAGALGLALGCAHESRETQTAVAQHQSQSEQALAKAADSQKQANEKQQTAEKDESRVKSLRNELAQAQTKAAEDRQLATNAQQKAMQDAQEASRIARQEQRQALEQQQQHSTLAPRQTQEVSGTVAKAGDDFLLINRGDQGPLRLQIDDNTRVMLNGETAHGSDLTEGAQVRASYVPGATLPVATRVEAQSGDSSSGG